ncbi:hypothetical protein [Actinomadura violacea]|uniref:Uncharacterized protein n=1 Tax=Actinomadura violacea TaxID=2819934 RepID=A0ABS3RY72_9ACTN|nr:hypothetical protein [Actinomadura violacea]MBO2461657.1 hypothetical protein [Actinomadura violacea]
MPPRQPIPGRPTTARPARPSGSPSGRPAAPEGAEKRPRRNRPPQPPRAETREQAVAYINPTPPANLTAKDREEIQILAGLQDREYDRAVNEWVSLDPTAPASAEEAAEGARVFYSAELAIRTFQASGRLISNVESKFRGLDRASQKFLDLESHKNKLSAVRAQSRRIRSTLFEQKADESPKNQANRVIADLFPKLQTHIRWRIKNGETPEEVYADLRAKGVGEPPEQGK